ncbi:unnamed protein product [Amoebophrya sp. A25]|nr:unnamed protein product [Amoebophrya sp. A25]|eukprot:GSA25T00005541001.1
MQAVSRFLLGRPQNLRRASRFAELTRLDVEHFQNVLDATSGSTNRRGANKEDVANRGSSVVLASDFGSGRTTSSSSSSSSSAKHGSAVELDRYNRDWLGTVEGHSQCVLRPRTTEQISAILKHCHDRGLAVCPQGGNTGLVGGSVPVFDEIVLSLERMNGIVDIDERSGVAVFEAGCVLEQANSALEKKGLLFPLDLGAKGSCQIGGNLATNAGGLRLLRYGNLHGNCLGLEFVKADGSVVDVLSRNKKDNTGIDLKQLLIGSEGTLGIITKAAFQCPVLPGDTNVLLCAVRTYEDCVKLFQKARQELGEILSAFEFFDGRSVACTRDNLQLVPPEFLTAADSSSSDSGTSTTPSRFAVLIETSGGNGEHDSAKLEGLLESSSAVILDGTVAASGTQQRSFWQLRERIAEGLLKDGYTYKYDVSVPDISDIYKIVEAADKRLQSKPISRIVGYGHMGDGNLHLNVTSPTFDQEIQDTIEPWLWSEVSKYGGSVSAEHGIGLMKVRAVQYSKSEEALNLMKVVKNTMDPKGILNPYKVLDGDWPQEEG